jgi:hypothetical protein
MATVAVDGAMVTGAASLRQLVAYLEGERPPNPRPCGDLAKRLDDLVHENALAVGQAFLALNELAKFANRLLHFSEEVSAWGKDATAPPAAGLPAAAASAAVPPPAAAGAAAAAAYQPPPFEAARPAAARSPSNARAGARPPRRHRVRRERHAPAPAPPPAGVPAAAPADMEELDSSSDSSSDSSAHRPPRRHAGPGAVPRVASPHGAARGRPAGPGAKAAGAAAAANLRTLSHDSWAPIGGRPPQGPSGRPAGARRPSRPTAAREHRSHFSAIVGGPSATAGGPAAPGTTRRRSRSRGHHQSGRPRRHP